MRKIANSIKNQPALSLFIGVIAISSASILIRFAQEDTPSIVIAAYRLLFASLLLFPFAAKNLVQESKSVSKAHLLLLALAGLFLALHFAAWIKSLELTSIPSSVVLVTTTPLWVALLSPLILKEKITYQVWLGMIVAMIGSILIVGKNFCSFENHALVCNDIKTYALNNSLTGNLLALLGAWMAAGYMMIGRKVRPYLSLSSYTLAVYGIAAFFLLIMVFILREPLIGYPIKSYGWMLLLAIVPQLIGHSSYNWALRYLPAAYVSIALLGEPIGTVILAYFFLGEFPKTFELIGGGLILIGIFWTTRLKRESEREQQLPL